MAQEARTTANDTVENHVVESRTAADMVAELREKIERYKKLEAEISKVDQEQVTLENYTQTGKGKRSAPAPKSSKKKQVSKNSKEGEEEDDYGVEKEDTVILGSSQPDGAADDLVASVEEAASPLEHEGSASRESVPNGRTEKTHSRKRSRGNDDDDEESDSFDPPESDVSSESDEYEADDVIVDISPGKGKRSASEKATAKKATPKKTRTAAGKQAKLPAKAVKKPTTAKRVGKAAEKAPSLSSAQKPSTDAVADMATKRASGSLGPLLCSPPRATKTSRPLLSPSSSRSSLSSTSLTLLASPSKAQKRKPMVATKSGTSLRDILSKSSAPRAGLRRVIKKTA
ncbi:hypothetical protein GGI22_004776 [Coemansia erecta]|nr:hypothetical protein GGI22_004776 [Coemansia erecta]